jgi:hypothetical protein
MRILGHSENSNKRARALVDVTQDLSQQPYGFSVLVAIAVATSILLLLLPFAAGQHGVPLACFVLLPVFGLGSLGFPRTLRPTGETNKILPSQAPALASLFQRPPPAFA